MQSSYYSNLSAEDANCLSHCTRCMLSDQSKGDKFDSSCKQQHEDTCAKCSMVHQLFTIMDTILTDIVLVADFTDHKKDLLLYRLGKAKGKFQTMPSVFMLKLNQYVLFSCHFWVSNVLGQNARTGKVLEPEDGRKGPQHHICHTRKGNQETLKWLAKDPYSYIKHNFFSIFFT